MRNRHNATKATPSETAGQQRRHIRHQKAVNESKVLNREADELETAGSRSFFTAVLVSLQGNLAGRGGYVAPQGGIG
jgi:hypothetical protein